MGVVNVTPDSFSDGGKHATTNEALCSALEMADAGAHIIDIGGESTRPGATPVTVEQEVERVLPVIESLANQCDVAISIDSSKPEVMRAAVDAGASLVNDVYALQRAGSLDAVADLDCLICLMHMQGEPQTMQSAPRYVELPGDIIRFLEGRVRACEAAGIAADRIIVDPGFGFGKDDRQNLEILAKLDQFAELNLPLLVGLSRKSMLGNLTGNAVTDRLAPGLAAAVIAVQKGARIVRTHDVKATLDAMALVDALRDIGNGYE